ncbi:MAG: metallophosphoesterase, partial [Candidatus Micrarchaeota archaeon]|nr:metallophosphoesterase [Candidatus Micrarchaeota archaeon]
MEENLLFVKDEPALLLKKQRILVVGDLHIGVEFKMGREGINFPNSSLRLAARINKICKESRAKSVLFLGDIKERIGFPTSDEADEIRTFFRALECKRIMIAKGNHDSRIGDILGSMGLDISIEREFIVGKFVLMHGNSWPSEEGMKKEYVITGHLHPALKSDSNARKVWLISPIGKGAAKAYPDCNKGIKLVIAPAFNNLIIGSNVDSRTRGKLILFKNEIFDFNKTKVYGLDGHLLGTLK